MALYHLHLLNWLSPDSKLEGQSHGLELQEIWTQVVFDDTRAWIIFVTGLIVDVLLWNIH